MNAEILDKVLDDINNSEATEIRRPAKELTAKEINDILCLARKKIRVLSHAYAFSQMRNSLSLSCTNVVR